MAALEGGIGALALASGQAAVTYAIQTIAGRRQHHRQRRAVWRHLQPVCPHLPQFGIDHPLCRPASWKASTPCLTTRKAVFIESLGNPLGKYSTFAAIAESPTATVCR